MEAKRAIFLDKDGTLIPDIPYNVKPELIRLNDGVLNGLALLKDKYVFIVVSNQSGIAQGLFKKEALMGVETRLNTLLAEAGINLPNFYYCPHHEDEQCICRKPKPGLLFKAAHELQIDLAQSWMIGDILHDVEAGKNAGCKSILVDVGNETEWKVNGNVNRIPDFIARNFEDAVAHILKKDLKQLNYEKQLPQFV